MQMPDARDYGGSYAPFSGHGDGGYGVAAGLGGAAVGAGAGAASYGPSAYDDETYSHSNYTTSDHNAAGLGAGMAGAGAGAGASAAAIAKQRESAMERQRQRNSTGYDQSGGPAGASGNRPSTEGGYSDDYRRTSTVYEHTDMASVPDEEEIPPK